MKTSVAIPEGMAIIESEWNKINGQELNYRFMSLTWDEINSLFEQSVSNVVTIKFKPDRAMAGGYTDAAMTRDGQNGTAGDSGSVDARIQLNVLKEKAGSGGQKVLRSIRSLALKYPDIAPEAMAFLDEQAERPKDMVYYYIAQIGGSGGRNQGQRAALAAMIIAGAELRGRSVIGFIDAIVREKLYMPMVVNLKHAAEEGNENAAYALGYLFNDDDSLLDSLPSLTISALSRGMVIHGNGFELKALAKIASSNRSDLRPQALAVLRSAAESGNQEAEKTYKKLSYELMVDEYTESGFESSDILQLWDRYIDANGFQSYKNMLSRVPDDIRRELILNPHLRLAFLAKLSRKNKGVGSFQFYGQERAREKNGLAIKAFIEDHLGYAFEDIMTAHEAQKQGIEIIFGITDSNFNNNRQYYVPFGHGFLGFKGTAVFEDFSSAFTPRRDFPAFLNGLFLEHEMERQALAVENGINQGVFIDVIGRVPLLKVTLKQGFQLVELKGYLPHEKAYINVAYYPSVHRLRGFVPIILDPYTFKYLKFRIAKGLGREGLSLFAILKETFENMGTAEAIKINKNLRHMTLNDQDIVVGGVVADTSEMDEISNVNGGNLRDNLAIIGYVLRALRYNHHGILAAAQQNGEGDEWQKFYYDDEGLLWRGFFISLFSHLSDDNLIKVREYIVQGGIDNDYKPIFLEGRVSQKRQSVASIKKEIIGLMDGVFTSRGIKPVAVNEAMTAPIDAAMAGIKVVDGKEMFWNAMAQNRERILDQLATLNSLVSSLNKKFLRNECRRGLELENTRFIFLTDDVHEKIFGYVLAGKQGTTKAFITVLVVTNEEGYRGRGLGALLFKKMLDRLDKEGVREVILVATGNSVNFYRRVLGPYSDLDGVVSKTPNSEGDRKIQIDIPTLYERHPGFKIYADGAMAVKGGIDLTSDKALSVQNNGQGIKFHLDPAMLQQLQNAPGFVPVIINIQPLTNLRQFLGLEESIPQHQQSV